MLAYITFIFIVSSATYGVYVAPQFQDLFISLDMNGLPSDDFSWFFDNWALFTSVIVFCLIICLLISIELASLFKFHGKKHKSFGLGFLIPRKIKAKHENIYELLTLPAQLSKNDNQSHNIFTKKFSSQVYTEKDIALEISNLISINVHSLTKLSESYIRKIYTVVALLIIFSIYQFLYSAYSPLFQTGSIS